MKQPRKVKVWCFTSLDGKISRTYGDIDFILNYIEIGKCDYGLEEFSDSISCGIISRKLYETLKAYDRFPLEQKPCHIVSNEQFPFETGKNLIPMLISRENNYSFIKNIQKLQQTADGDIWLMGGHELLTAAFSVKIVTELTINILPVFLGNGLPLFPIGNYESSWTAIKSHKFNNGVLQIQYKRD